MNQGANHYIQKGVDTDSMYGTLAHAIRDAVEKKRAVGALKESENEYRTIFETTGTATVIIEADTTLSLVNTQFEELSGYSREEVEGKKSWTEFVVDEDLERMKEFHRLRRSDPNAAPTNYEFKLVDKAGNIKTIFLSVSMIPGTGKSIASLLDLTEHKRAEEVLKRYQVMVESVHDAIFFKDLNSRYISANDKTLEAFGLSRDDVIGKNDYELMPDEEEARKNVEDDQVVFKTGKPTEVIKHMTGADGKEYWFEAIKVPHFDTAGNIIGLIGVARDITERKRAEEALRESEKRLTILFDSIPSGIVLIDAETHEISSANPAAVKMIGVPQEQIIGSVCHEFICPAEKGRCPISDLGQSIDNSERVLLKADGKRTPILKTVVPTMLDGRQYLLESFIDITGHKQTEKDRERLLGALEAKNRELERFTYTVSHDLRSPLITIQGFTDMLRKDLEENEHEKVESDLQHITKATTQMSRLLHDTLELSRIGRMANPPEDVSFGKIVDDALGQTAGELTARNVRMSVAKEFPTVHVDRMRIVEALVNLITNCIKYMGDQAKP